MRKPISQRASAARVRGQGMTEYIIIVALIAIAAIGVVSGFGGVVSRQFEGMAQSLAGEENSGQEAAANEVVEGGAATLNSYGN